MSDKRVFLRNGTFTFVQVYLWGPYGLSFKVKNDIQVHVIYACRERLSRTVFSVECSLFAR